MVAFSIRSITGYQFTYNVTRPYPFKWFTPVAVLGGVVATVILSLFNIASNGVELTLQTVADPIATVKHYNSLWYERISAGRSRQQRASCQPNLITPLSQYYTNVSVLPWTGGSMESSGQQYAQSSAYDGPSLECEIYKIQIDVEHLDRGAAEWQVASWGNSMSVIAFCGTDTTTMYLTGSYTITGDMVDSTSPRSLYSANSPLAYALLGLWTWNVSSTLAWTQYNNVFQPPFRRALFQWYPVFAQDGKFNVSKPDAFNASYTIVPYGSDVLHQNDTTLGVFPDKDVLYQNGHIYGLGDPSDTYFGGLPFSQVLDHGVPGLVNDTTILYGIDRLVRCMHSVALFDLGSSSFAQASHIMTDTSLLQKFTVEEGWDIEAPFFDKQASQDYGATIKAYVRSPQTETLPAVLSLLHLCQVPKLKPTGDLILSVLVADLVILHALWVIYNWMARWLLRKDKQANYCEGCLAAQENSDENVEMKPLAHGMASNSRQSSTIASSGQASEVVDAYEPLEVTLTSPLTRGGRGA